MDRPLGYAWFLETQGVRALRPYHLSRLGTIRRVEELTKGERTETFPRSFAREEAPLEQLLFALKYDGLALDILAEVLPSVAKELSAAVTRSPTSASLRQLWFFYEWLGGARLPLADAPRLSYVPAADPERYFTTQGARSQRHKVLNNLLGDSACSPLVRRSEALTGQDEARLAARAQAVTEGCDPVLLARAIQFLYTKETRTSFAIEREEVRGRKEERFVALLRRIDQPRRIDRDWLVASQNAIADQRFIERDYRAVQNYVGESSRGDEIVHYVPPRPEDLPALMSGFEALVGQLCERNAAVPAVVAAAIVSFMFVYLHPFEDGNGRLHRLLIHLVLARRQLFKSQVIMPVSAAMLAEEAFYKNELLPAVDRQLMPLITWALDDDLRISARGNDRRLYAYLDLTAHAEALYRWVERSIEVEMAGEISFLRAFDRARKAMRVVVELPDRLEALFIHCCRETGFRLSQTKRRSHFEMLSEEEIARLEVAVEGAFTGALEQDAKAGGGVAAQPK
jgi:hypothetical protein